MDYILGVESNESRKLRDELIHDATSEKIVYKDTWENDDVVMCDNHWTMHGVEPFDNTSVRKIMHRVTLVGDNQSISIESTWPQLPNFSFRMVSAIFSAVIIVGKFVLAHGTTGKIEASTTRKPAIPLTLP